MTIIRLEDIRLTKERREYELELCKERLEKLYLRYRILSEQITTEEAILRILEGDKL